MSPHVPARMGTCWDPANALHVERGDVARSTYCLIEFQHSQCLACARHLLNLFPYVVICIRGRHEIRKIRLICEIALMAVIPILSM